MTALSYGMVYNVLCKHWLSEDLHLQNFTLTPNAIQQTCSVPKVYFFSFEANFANTFLI